MKLADEPDTAFGNCRSFNGRLERFFNFRTISSAVLFIIMPALVKTLSRKKGSSKSTAPGPGKTSASVTPAKRKKHAWMFEDEDDVEAEVEVQKKAKKLKGKEQEKTLGTSQEKAKAKDVEVKPKPKDKVPVPARKAEVKEKDKSRKTDGKEEEVTKRATGKKGVAMGTLKGSTATESKTKRRKALTFWSESSDAEADSGESDEEEDEDEDEAESEVGSSDDDKSDGTQKEAGASSDQDEAVSGEEEEDADADEDEETHLRGFSSNESDSSDEEDEDEAVNKAPPIDVGKLPTVAKDDATVKRKLDKAKKQASGERGVIYLGRIPHGFYEDQMRAYFSQFGDVTRLRLSRNKKTGRSKHYAFIEFKSAAVAQIVAETMDNYLLMGHLLQCKLVPKEEVHPELWIGSNRKFRKVPMARLERLQQNKTRTAVQKKKIERRALKRQEQKKRKLEALGIDYDMAPFSYSKKNRKDA
ncbi:NOP15 [Sanghuangporus sanghuang]